MNTIFTPTVPPKTWSCSKLLNFLLEFLFISTLRVLITQFISHENEHCFQDTQPVVRSRQVADILDIGYHFEVEVSFLVNMPFRTAWYCTTHMNSLRCTTSFSAHKVLLSNVLAHAWNCLLGIPQAFCLSCKRKLINFIARRMYSTVSGPDRTVPYGITANLLFYFGTSQHEPISGEMLHDNMSRGAGR